MYGIKLIGVLGKEYEDNWQIQQQAQNGIIRKTKPLSMVDRLIVAWEDAEAKVQSEDRPEYVWVHLKRRERIRNILIKRYNYYTKY